MENLDICELGRYEIRLVLGSYFGVRTYAFSEDQTQELSFHESSKRNLFVTLPKCVQSFGKLCRQARARLWYEMSVPTAIETQIYLCATVIISTNLCKKTQHVIRHEIQSMIAIMAVYHVKNAWSVFSISHFIRSMQVDIQP